MKRKSMEGILHQIKAYFDPFINTKLADWRALASYLTLEQIKSRGMVKLAEEKEGFLRFILEGAAAMLMRQGSKDVCFDLCFENDFLTDFESLNSGEPSMVHIRTFEPLYAVVIDRSSLLQFYSTSSFCAQLGRVVAEQQNRRSQMNHIGYLGKTAEDRYRKLLRDRPERTASYAAALPCVLFGGVDRELKQDTKKDWKKMNFIERKVPIPHQNAIRNHLIAPQLL